MSKSVLLVLMLALGGGLIALWQNQAETALRDMPAVSEVAIDAAGELRIGGRFARDCAGAPQAEIKRFPGNLDIELFRERSSLAACGLQAASFDIPLELAPGSLSRYIIINDEIWAMTTGQAKGVYERQRLSPAIIDEASIVMRDDEDNAYQLSIRGSQAVGCDLPEIYSMRQAEGRVQIGVYNALSAAAACPDMLLEVRETITLPATELAVDALFGVNTFLIERLETNIVSDSDKVLTNITSVNVNVMESLPAQISLEIEGEHPDGCDLPVQVEQARAGNTVQVDIYRIVPADLICPMILQPYQDTIELAGNFDSGSYTIKVNSHTQTLNI